MENIKITIQGRAAVGKTTLAYYIKHLLTGAQIKCEILTEPEEPNEVIEKKTAMASTLLSDTLVQIVERQVCHDIVAGFDIPVREKTLVENALQCYWLENNKTLERKDAGDIEREQAQSACDRVKALMKELDML